MDKSLLEAHAVVRGNLRDLRRLFVVLVAAMGRDLATDFSARETSCVHICIGGPGPECAHEASEVMQVEGLIG